MNKLLILLFVFIMVTGCSARGWYDNIQLNNRQACSQEPPGQYEECIERSNQPYEEYEQEREALE